MIAYNHSSLENLLTRKETEKAYRKGYISEAEKENIYQAYPVSFYSPNIFVRIGLFILTVVIGLFTLGLLGLLFMNQVEDVIGGLIVFFGSSSRVIQMRDEWPATCPFSITIMIEKRNVIRKGAR